jgi:hypothetical protein
VLRSNGSTSRSCARVICPLADRRRAIRLASGVGRIARARPPPERPARRQSRYDRTFLASLRHDPKPTLLPQTQASWTGMAVPGRFLCCARSSERKLGTTGRTDVRLRRRWRSGLIRASDFTPASSFLVGAPDNRRLFALSGDNPDPFIEPGDNALRRGRLEKGDMRAAGLRLRTQTLRAPSAASVVAPACG